MPCVARLRAVERDAELAAVLARAARAARAACSSTTAGPRRAGCEWSIVATVRSGRRTFRPRAAQAGEGLRRGHLVDQVQVDVEDGGRARLLRDDVGVPDLLEQRARLGHVGPAVREKGRPVYTTEPIPGQGTAPGVPGDARGRGEAGAG